MASVPLTQPRPRAIPARRQALTLAVAQVAVAALLGGLVELALLYSGVAVTPPWQVVLFVVGAWTSVVAGTVAWLRRPGSLMGLLMIGGGFAWLAAGLANTSVPALTAAGLVAATLPIAVVVHLLLAFPSGRLRSRIARATTIGGYGVCLLLQVPSYAFGFPNPLRIADRPDLADAGLWAQRIAGAAVVLVTAVILTRRLRDARPAQRRVLTPLWLYGIVAVLAFPLGSGLADLRLGGGGLTLVAIQLLIVAGVPIAFVVAASLGGFARTGEVEELGASLGADDGGRVVLADVLVAALGDETVELRASRARLVEAGDAERRRIARDLHDGLQSRLVLLAVQAGVAKNGTAAELRAGIEVAIDELRALVHGVMPAELTERGLPAAVEGLADRMPIAVLLEVDGLERRLPPAVESTGFFVVSEALVNAVKHAHASELSVTLARERGDRLRIEVRDDGVGGAGTGNGTRSIADRVEALGGRLRIESGTGAGTCVHVELPCGW